MPTKRDKNHNELIKAMKTRCGGYWKDREYPHHYAHIKGLPIAAYDTSKMGNGYPDWDVNVSWLNLKFEIKQERAVKDDPRGRKRELNDREYYWRQLEESEKYFYNHHPGIVILAWEQNQIFEWISLAADFVICMEGQRAEIQNYVELFFPKTMDRENTSN